MNYQYKQLLGAMIVAGWDKERGGQVYGCPIGGTLVQENWTTDGSGSTYIWGYLDATFRHASNDSLPANSAVDDPAVPKKSNLNNFTGP